MQPVPAPPLPPSAAVHVLPLGAELLADLSDWQVHLHARSFTRVAVDMLLRDLRRTVPSALGYTLVLVSGPGQPEVSITVAEGPLRPGEVRSTLTFALPVVQDVSARATFYAAGAGALSPLATMLRSSATFGAAPVVLGASLHADVEPGVRGLADHTRVNHAFGVLLGRGESVAQAERHLDRLVLQHGSLQAAAEHVLADFGA